MNTQTTKQREQLAGLMELYRQFLTSGDLVNAEKMKQLLAKLVKEERILAFCGHFSAGKSSMINYLLGDQVLPSSPIPTSANTVKLQKGDDYALVYYHEGEPNLFPAPYDYQTVKNFAKDGAAISSITISSSTFPLPPTCSVMDTPGIDSTDDAHRVSTESALHLADAVFYVMDYNHVQSEVNFLFTKELMDEGKKVYLIVNMIDKHDEAEITFADFKKSVENAFTNWSVYPEKIFYTSVRDLDNPNNQLEEVREFIFKTADNGVQNTSDSALLSAQRLINRHVLSVKDKFDEAFAEDFEPLFELPSEERTVIESNVSSLMQEREQLAGTATAIERSFTRSLEVILKNAYLMPAPTRELAKDFLEAHQPDFKIGLFFAKKKTESVKEERLKAFEADLQEKVKTQLEWHIKELAGKTLIEAKLHDAECERAAQSLSIPLSADFLLNTLKSDVNSSGEFVLNYTKDLAESLKKEAKRAADTFLDMVKQRLLQVNEIRLEELSDQLAEYAEYENALELMHQKDKEAQAVKQHLEEILYGNTEPASNFDQLLRECTEEEAVITIHSEVSIKEKTKQKPKEPVTAVSNLKHEKAQVRGKGKLEETADHLRQVSGWVQPLTGFHTLYRELVEKAERLERQTFTVALFGAFSAGKSSFANALIGESVLPVSPNPTTAAINKIQAADHNHDHGTANVTLKTADMLLEDVSIALEAFGQKAISLDLAYEAASHILSETSIDKGKTHLSFLRAFIQGYPEHSGELGTTITVDLTGFKAYAAEEAKSCFVDLIDLYYDCALTKQGMVLVDTPGADSINARHTGAAFEYIKNADAILFVTYYNHPFSKADREFLIQLGRVKDSFAMDKMFFVVNAVDLAQDNEELDEVIDYVQNQLGGFGIRFPKLFPVTSKGALAEKQAAHSFSHHFLQDSGMKHFEKVFHGFIEQDLTNLAIVSAMAAIARTETLLQEVLTTSKQDEASKAAALRQLAEDYQQVLKVAADIQDGAEQQKLRKEIDELIYYSKQRVFFRFADFFKESFNPAVIKEGEDLKTVLREALRNFLNAIGFDFGQEMRATSFRTEMTVHKLVREKQASFIQQAQRVKKTLSLQPYDPEKKETLEFQPAFHNLSDQEFRKELGLFKNPKAFFEKNEKVMMSQALQERLDPLALAYVSDQGNRLYEEYSVHLHNEIDALKQATIAAVEDIFMGLKAGLEETVDADYFEEIIEKVQQIVQD